MIKLSYLALLALINLAMPEALAQFREFRSKEGTPIQARLINKNDEEVTIEAKEGRRFTIRAERFSDEDQIYIKNWVSPTFEYSISKSDHHKRISGGAFTKETLKGYEIRISQSQGRGFATINTWYVNEFLQSLKECRFAFDRIADAYIPKDFEAVVKTRTQSAEFKISFDQERSGNVGVISFQTIYLRRTSNYDSRLMMCYGKIRERDIEYIIDYLTELDVEAKIRIIREAENKVSR